MPKYADGDKVTVGTVSATINSIAAIPDTAAATTQEIGDKVNAILAALKEVIQ